MFENLIQLEAISSMKKFNRYKIEPLDSGDFMVRPETKHGIVESTMEISGIAYKFARIRTQESVLDFANEFGLLGLHPANVYIRRNIFTYMKNYVLRRSPVGGESISEWELHINHVRRLLKLHKAITAGNPIEDDLLRVGMLHPDREIYMTEFISAVRREWADNFHGTVSRDDLQTGRFVGIIHGSQFDAAPRANHESPHYLWYDNVPTLLPFTEMLPVTEEGFVALAKIVLMLHLEEMLKYSVIVDYRHVLNKLPLKTASELKFVDRKATPYLLTAIYHDVWRIVNNRERVEDCTSCGLPFPLRRKGSEYCSKACKQREWRNSKK